MIKKIAIVGNETGISQSSSMAFDALNYLAENTTIDTLFFRGDVGPLIKVPLFGIFGLDHLWYYNGIAVAIDEFSARKLLNCPMPKKKYFYIQNMDWNSKSLVTYAQLQNIYNNPQLELITRNQDHHDLVKSCWNRDSIIIPNFDHKLLEALVEEQYE